MVGLVLMKASRFCLLVTLFISSSILNDSLVSKSILGCSFFTFSTWNILCYFLWSTKFLQNNQLIMDVCGFPHTKFLIFILLPLLFYCYLKFCHFKYDMDWFGSLWVHLIWNSLLPKPRYWFPSSGSLSV